MKNMIVIEDTDLVHRVSDLKQVSKFGPWNVNACLGLTNGLRFGLQYRADSGPLADLDEAIVSPQKVYTQEHVLALLIECH